MPDETEGHELPKPLFVERQIDDKPQPMCRLEIIAWALIVFGMAWAGPLAAQEPADSSKMAAQLCKQVLVKDTTRVKGDTVLMVSLCAPLEWWIRRMHGQAEN